MKTLLKAALAAALVAGAGSAAQADLTFQGAVGLPLNPTAQIPLPGGARIQGDYFDFGDNGKAYGAHAAARIGSRLEINGGVIHLDPDAAALDSDTGLDIGAKYLITRETTDPDIPFRLAVGGGYSDALSENAYGYIVGSKAFGTSSRVITGHLGLRYDHFDFGVGDSNKVSVYAGVEVPITQGGDFAFVGELGTKVVDGGDAPYSASLRYRPAGKGYSASLGVARPGIAGDNGIFAQLGYTFDTAS